MVNRDSEDEEEPGQDEEEERILITEVLKQENYRLRALEREAVLAKEAAELVKQHWLEEINRRIQEKERLQRAMRPPNGAGA
jgi:hypothetical protein